VGKLIDLTGKKFGRLTPIKCCGKNSHGQYLWLCRCDCGNEKVILGYCLQNGNTKSCGCFNIEQKTSWTKAEVNILTEFYPEKGATWCANKLKKSIYRTRHKINRLGLHTKYRDGKRPREIINLLSKTVALASCPKHGICKHQINKKNNGLRCQLCAKFCAKKRDEIEEIRIKRKERERKWRKKWLENPINKFAHNLRHRMGDGLKRISKNNALKTKGCFRHLSYGIKDLFNHLENIKKLQNNKCPSCKVCYDKCKISIDHIIPLATAKTEKEIIDLFDLKNLSLLCKNCNSSKNDNNLHEWNKKKEYFNNCVSIG